MIQDDLVKAHINVRTFALPLFPSLALANVRVIMDAFDFDKSCTSDFPL